MIISIRGASGAGKTHLVKRFMAGCDVLRTDTGYIAAKGDEVIFIPGNYERINGGIDSLADLGTAYDLAKYYARRGMHVVMEGRGHEDGTRELLALRDAALPVAVALIEHPLADCCDAVARRGYYIPAPAIRRMHERCAQHHLTFCQEHIPCFAGDREAVFQQVEKWIVPQTASCPAS